MLACVAAVKSMSLFTLITWFSSVSLLIGLALGYALQAVLFRLNSTATGLDRLRGVVIRVMML